MAVLAVGQWVYFARRGFIGRLRPTRVARGVGAGLVRVARLPYDAATFIVREITPTSRNRSDK